LRSYGGYGDGLGGGGGHGEGPGGAGGGSHLVGLGGGGDEGVGGSLELVEAMEEDLAAVRKS
jgi:hypothetical protein